jgi:hypothetical protein
MPRRLVFLNEADGLNVAPPRVSKSGRSFRNQNCRGRAWIQIPLQPCLSRSCATDLCVCVLRRDVQLAVLRFFIGAKRQRFLATLGTHTNHAQPRWTAARMRRGDPSGCQ